MLLFFIVLLVFSSVLFFFAACKFVVCFLVLEISFSSCLFVYLLCICFFVYFYLSFIGQVKDSGYNDRYQCREIAKQFVADSKIVGVVGAFRSSCSIELNQYFKTKCKTKLFTSKIL